MGEGESMREGRGEEGGEGIAMYSRNCSSCILCERRKKKRFFLKRAKSRNEFQVLVNYLYSQVHRTLLGR